MLPNSRYLFITILQTRFFKILIADNRYEPSDFQGNSKSVWACLSSSSSIIKQQQAELCKVDTGHVFRDTEILLLVHQSRRLELYTGKLHRKLPSRINAKEVDKFIPNPHTVSWYHGTYWRFSWGKICVGTHDVLVDYYHIFLGAYTTRFEHAISWICGCLSYNNTIFVIYSDRKRPWAIKKIPLCKLPLIIWPYDDNGDANFKRCHQRKYSIL